MERKKKSEKKKTYKTERTFSKFWCSSEEIVTGATLLCSLVAVLKKRVVVIGSAGPKIFNSSTETDSFTQS